MRRSSTLRSSYSFSQSANPTGGFSSADDLLHRQEISSKILALRLHIPTG
jgi:hypothetical protein